MNQWRRSVTVLAAAFLAVPAGVVLAAPVLAQEDDGLVLGVDTAYRLDGEEGLVEVILEVAATNTLSDESDEFGVTRFYFDEVVFVVPSEAVDVDASSESGPMPVSVTPRDTGGVSEVAVSLAPRLYSGSTTNFRLRFSLPGEPPRSAGEIRVNEAFAWFILWAYGDAGRSSVTAVLEPGFEVEVLGDELERTVRDNGIQVFRASEIEDPAAWVSVISARNDAALRTSEIRVGESLVTLDSWPGDPQWVRVVTEVLSGGIPLLEESTGFEWDTDLNLIQSFGPFIQGHSDWYVEGAETIEIGEELDAHLILHEVSHAWFNESLFSERWIVEGLADTYAALAVDSLGVEGRPQDSSLPSVPANPPLNEWVAPTFDERVVDRTEDSTFTAPWQVVAAIVDDIGVDGMSEVLASAASDLIAYRGDGPPEQVGPVDDWRRFLDLLEEVGGADGAGALFAEFVVTDDQQSLLAQRASVRTDYERLRAEAGSWTLPLDLRLAMSDWAFDDAASSIQAATSVIAAREELAALATTVAVTPPSLEVRFEAGEDAGVLEAEMAAQTVVLQTVLDAAAAVSRPRSFVETVGMWGSDPSAALATARIAVESGDLATARTSATDAIGMVESAADDGVVRLISAVAAILLIGTLVVVLMRRRRSIARDPESVEVPSI